MIRITDIGAATGRLPWNRKEISDRHYLFIHVCAAYCMSILGPSELTEFLPKLLGHSGIANPHIASGNTNQDYQRVCRS